MSINPYEGLKHTRNRQKNGATKVAMSINPYEGLKQGQGWVAESDGSSVAMSINPYEGLKQCIYGRSGKN